PPEEEAELDGIRRIARRRAEGSVRVRRADDDRAIESPLARELLEEARDDARVRQQGRGDRLAASLEDDRERLRRRREDAGRRAAPRLLTEGREQARAFEPPHMVVDLLLVEVQTGR